MHISVKSSFTPTKLYFPGEGTCAKGKGSKRCPPHLAQGYMSLFTMLPLNSAGLQHPVCSCPFLEPFLIKPTAALGEKDCYPPSTDDTTEAPTPAQAEAALGLYTRTV